MNTAKKEDFVEKSTRDAMYHVIAWMEDEGDYQPTEEEAQEKVRAVIIAAIEHGREEGRREMREEIEILRHELSKTHYPNPQASQYYAGFEGGKEAAQDLLSRLMASL